MFNNKIWAYKEGKPIPSHTKFLVKLSEQPFSRNSPNSQFTVNPGKSWRTCLASGRWQAVSHQRKLAELEELHRRWPHLSGLRSEPACLRLVEVTVESYNLGGKMTCECGHHPPESSQWMTKKIDTGKPIWPGTFKCLWWLIADAMVTAWFSDL